MHSPIRKQPLWPYRLGSLSGFAHYWQKQAEWEGCRTSGYLANPASEPSSHRDVQLRLHAAAALTRHGSCVRKPSVTWMCPCRQKITVLAGLCLAHLHSSWILLTPSLWMCQRLLAQSSRDCSKHCSHPYSDCADPVHWEIHQANAYPSLESG